MADNRVIVTKYDHEAIRQMEQAFTAAGGSAGNTGGGSSGNGGNSRGDNNEAVEDSTGALEQFIGATEKASGALASIRNLTGSRGLNMMLEEFRSGLVGGVEALDGNMESLKGMKEGIIDYAARAKASFADMGISIKETNELNTASRAASVNLGGLAAWTDKLKEGQKEYFSRLGGYSAAAEYQVQMMNMLVQSGGEAVDLYGDFGKSLKGTNDDLLKMGISYKESSEFIAEMSKDENIRQKLMSAAGKKERLQIILETQARFANLKAIGMSTEQAKEATKALAALSGKGPLDRIKESAKMQAGLSALGIENASEVARIYRLGDRATKEELEILRVALGRMQEISKESRMDTMGRELSTAAIMERTGLDKIPEIFSEKLGAIGSAITEDQRSRMQILGKDTENANKIVSAIDKLNTAMNDSWIPELPGMLADIASFGMKNITGLAAIGTAAALLDGYQAVTTGESSTWDAINVVMPNAVAKFYDGVEWFGGWVEKLTGADKDEKDAKSKEREEKRKQDESARKQMENFQQRMDALMSRVATASQQNATAYKDQIAALQAQSDVLKEGLGYQKKTADNTNKPLADMKGPTPN